MLIVNSKYIEIKTFVDNFFIKITAVKLEQFTFVFKHKPGIKQRMLWIYRQPFWSVCYL